MNQPLNIMVTGCGGDIGQSIGKILKSNPLFGKVIGCDMSDENASLFIFDQVNKVPACRAAHYTTVLEEIIHREKIDLILPIAEPELRKFAEDRIEKTFLGKPVICANLKALDAGFDKLATVHFLEAAGLPFPSTAVIGEVTDPQLPLIMKSRSGSGSKTIHLIRSREDFDFLQKKYPDYIVQELLENDEEEYTCGLFRSTQGEVRTIIYRRKLTGGFSGFGVVTENEAIHQLLVQIATGLNLVGSINVQLRLVVKGPCVFEINPRFSSTVRFRHLMGFDDVIWSVQDALGLPIDSYQPPINGTKFYKGFTEYVN